MDTDEIKEMVTVVVTIITGMVFLLVLAFIIIYALISPINYATCNQKNEIMISQGFEPKFEWGFWSGCQFVHNGVLIPPDNIFLDGDGKIIIDELR